MTKTGKIAIGSDHAGYLLKEAVKEFLASDGFAVVDVGAYNQEPSDYPDFARAVSGAILGRKAKKGILICGSGVGASVAANKFPGIRAAVCHDTYSAHQGVEHDDMNLLCIGERVIGAELAKEIALAFVFAKFSGIERHVRRLKKVKQIEREFMKK